MITMRSYRLGAEELVELGRAKNFKNAGRQPFFSNRPRMAGGPRIGDALDVAGGFITSTLDFDLRTLSALADVPLDVLSKGADITMSGVADLLENVPTVGDLLAEILVQGAVALKFSLSVPGLSRDGLGNILLGIGRALGAQNTTAENDQKVRDAKDGLMNKAPAGSEDAVKQVLGSVAPAGGSSAGTLGQAEAVPRMSNFEKAVLVGIPMAGMAAVAFLSR